MNRATFVAAAVIAAIGLSSAGLAGDWKSAAVKKAVGKAAREGLEEVAEQAVKDIALEAALDAALPATASSIARRAMDFDVDDVEDAVDDVGDALERSVDRAERTLKKVDSKDVVGAVAGEGVETALRVADVAEDLDDVADAVGTLRKIDRVRRIVK